MTSLAQVRTDDARPQPKGATLDWIIISLIAAGFMVLLGLAALVWMFSNREYWRADPSMPTVFLMFSKIINGSTLGVLGVFIGTTIAACAILCLYLRAKEDAAIQRHEQIAAKLDTLVKQIQGSLRSHKRYEEALIELRQAIDMHTAPRNVRWPENPKSRPGTVDLTPPFTGYLARRYDDWQSEQ